MYAHRITERLRSSIATGILMIVHDAPEATYMRLNSEN